MALHSHDYGSPSGLPISAVLQSIPSFPRPVIERLVARLIDHLDEQDAPFADMEEDDPAEDGHDAEREEADAAFPTPNWYGSAKMQPEKAQSDKLRRATRQERLRKVAKQKREKPE